LLSLQALSKGGGVESGFKIDLTTFKKLSNLIEI
jgi:hypothetical protein